MNRSRSGLLLRRALWGVGLSLLPLPPQVRAQSSRPASPSTQQPVSAPKDAKAGQQYSGMYAFLREGEFVQVTIENEGFLDTAMERVIRERSSISFLPVANLKVPSSALPRKRCTRFHLNLRAQCNEARVRIQGTKRTTCLRAP